MKTFLEPVHHLAVPVLKMQVFERETSRSTKRNSITLSARRSFVAETQAFSGREKMVNRLLARGFLPLHAHA